MTNKKLGDKSVTLTITEDCNLNCVYCYEKHKRIKAMDFETAKKILDYELNVDDGFEHVLIDFFGGEPFLEFETIVRIVEYLKKGIFKKTFELYVITNGTLVHGEIQDWLIENYGFIDVTLSLDGNKLMHDMNRCNSFDLIDLEFFSKYYGKHGVKMTISPETLPFMFDGVVFCQEKGFDVYCNLAFTIDWNCKKQVDILSDELEKLIEYYIMHPQYKPCSILDFDIKLLGYDSPNKHFKWCGIKTNMHTYDTVGKCFPCQYFMGLTCGEEGECMAMNIDFPDEVPITKLNEECQKCIINQICPTCYGANYIYSGNIYIKDLSACEMNKTIIKARSYFKWLQWSSGTLTLSEEDEILLLRSIKKIQEVLN